MATQEGNERLSIREIEEMGVGGKNAPRDAREQLKNTRRARLLKDREKKRLKKLLAERRRQKEAAK